MVEFVRLPDVAMATLRLSDGGGHGLPASGQSTHAGTDVIIAIGPDEWLAIADDSDAGALCDRLAGYGGAVIDGSGNRVRYRVAGPRARWALSAGCSLDLDMLKSGQAASTLLARAQVVIYVESADGFIVLPRRSFAAYLETWAGTLND